MTYEIFKINSIWVSRHQFDTLEAAEAAALKKSAEYKETYAVRPVGGYTLAIFDCGVKFQAVTE